MRFQKTYVSICEVHHKCSMQGINNENHAFYRRVLTNVLTDEI